jgi:hypothetical protein
MQIQVKPIGEPSCSGSHIESDVTEIIWGTEGMRFVVEFWNRNDRSHKKEFIEVCFQKFCRYRVLEEVDLSCASYSDCLGFRSGHVVYEILSGGWISHDATGEHLLSYVTTCGTREWFICTSNWSAWVISKEEPLIRVLKG